MSFLFWPFRYIRFFTTTPLEPGTLTADNVTVTADNVDITADGGGYYP